MRFQKHSRFLPLLCTLVFALTGLALLLSGVARDAGATASGSVTGSVMAGSQPVAGATVRVRATTNFTYTDGSGRYSVTFADIPRGANGEIRYGTVVNYANVTHHLRFWTGDVLIQVNYQDDAVDGNFNPGHTGWVTVTESDGIRPRCW